MNKYNSKTQKIISLLLSDEFKQGTLSHNEIVRRLKVSSEVVRYHKYRIYYPERFKVRYLKK